MDSVEVKSQLAKAAFAETSSVHFCRKQLTEYKSVEWLQKVLNGYKKSILTNHQYLALYFSNVIF